MIIGNGIAGQTAAEELRAQDSECSIVMIAAERHPLYNRVALPRYLRGQVREEKVLMRTVENYAERNLEIHFETWATHIDPVAKVVSTDKAGDFPYDALLVATGGQPSPIIAAAASSKRVLIMGGSFIAYELAEGIAHRGVKVSWLMRGPRFLRYVLDMEGGELCRRLGEVMGVEFILEDEAKAFSTVNGHFAVETEKGRRVEFDALCYGVGLKYYTEPLAGTGVELNKGVVTDSRLRTNLPDVYAAGDIAVFYDLMVGKHNQMGTWDNAMAHGKVVAHNMAGADEEYFDVPTYTTTMFGSTMAVMGVTPDVQPDLESVRAFSYDEKFFRKLFFIDDRLVGAIMIGPPKGRKKLIEIMRSQLEITGSREMLLDPANLL